MRGFSFVVLLVVLMVAVAGCSELRGGPASTEAAGVTTSADGTATTAVETSITAAATTEAPPTTTLAATTTTAAPTPTTTETIVTLSAEALDYAASLGGTSHLGEELYFVIGTSVATEAEALDQLEGAKGVGDMQSYFIVQRSDNFEGMEPGWYVVFEAYRDYPSQENIDFGRRPFPGAYVKSAIVMTSDPIPVYDDIMMGD
jgi:hypothetical protein